MKPFFLVPFICLSFIVVSCDSKNITLSVNNEASFVNAEAAIKKSIQDWADACKNKDYNKATNLFDSTSDVMLIGSDSSEVLVGREQIAAFLKTMLSQPFTLSWEIKKIDVFHHQQTAWAYADGALLVTEKANTTRLPYRFVVVLAERNKEWKWKLYHGSEPKPQ